MEVLLDVLSRRGVEVGHGCEVLHGHGGVQARSRLDRGRGRVGARVGGVGVSVPRVRWGVGVKEPWGGPAGWAVGRPGGQLGHEAQRGGGGVGFFFFFFIFLFINPFVFYVLFLFIFFFIF